MECVRCGNDFDDPGDGQTNVCANCADDLRAEADAEAAELEDAAFAKFQKELDDERQEGG